MPANVTIHKKLKNIYKKVTYKFKTTEAKENFLNQAYFRPKSMAEYKSYFYNKTHKK